MNNADKLIALSHLNTVLPVVKELIEDTNESIKDAKLELREEIKDTKSTIVQPDWNEEDETSPAYIHNKPESLGGGVTWFSIAEFNCSTSSGSLKVVARDIITKGLVESNDIVTEGAETSVNEIVDVLKNGVAKCKILGSNGLLGYGTIVGYYFKNNSDRLVLYVSYVTHGTGVQNKAYYFAASTTSTSTTTTSTSV